MTATPDGDGGAGTQSSWMAAATSENLNHARHQRAWTLATMIDADYTKQHQQRTASRLHNGDIDTSNSLMKHCT